MSYQEDCIVFSKSLLCEAGGIGPRMEDVEISLR